MSQLVDDALDSAMEAEVKIADAIEIIRRVINVTSDFKGHLPSDVPVLHQKMDGAVTGEMTTADTDDRSWDIADRVEMSLYPKVGFVSLLHLSQLISPSERIMNHQYQRGSLSFFS